MATGAEVNKIRDSKYVEC